MIFGYWKVKGIKRNRDADIREIVKITQMIFADIEKVYVGLPRNFLLESTEIANIKVKLIISIKKVYYGHSCPVKLGNNCQSFSSLRLLQCCRISLTLFKI